MRQIWPITRKEINNYFSSPMALIFVGVFLAATLFTFFWVDAFFARGIADVRPLFRWMPILLIFLLAALTMRQWSEEQQTGTLEMLLTLPMNFIQLVVGKFFGVMVLVLVSLGLTFFIPITVSQLGDLDWGPVFGGYLAAILLASTYAAIGLFFSSRTDNQIVALILSVLVSGLFYLIGSPWVTDFVGSSLSEIFKAIGVGSHFESIQRGVIDLRDLVYYLSLTLFFLTLNVISLDVKRWGTGENTSTYRAGMLITGGLVFLNVVVLNTWLYPLNRIRLDLTEHQEYSLSQTTTDLLDNLQEPLLIRGYFSENIHPRLEPLVLRIQDMLEEYEAASDGQVIVEFVNPAENPEKEQEANQTYGIRPTPLRTADRYESAIVNIYFDLLIRYGDQSEVLNFRDLIEFQPYPDGSFDLGFRNLEYDLTRSIRKTVYGFQSIEAVLASMEQPVYLTLYLTPESLPEPISEVPQTIESVAQEIASTSNGKFQFEIVNVDDPNSDINRQILQEQFGIQPIPVSFFSSDSYYLHMILQIGDEAQLLMPSGELSEADLQTTIESALERASPGFLKTVGIWIPPQTPNVDPFGQQQPSFQQYQTIVELLRQEYNVRNVDLSSGQVPSDVDVLAIIAPQNMGGTERYAIDQYLMRGGAVVVAAGNYKFSPDQFSGQLSVAPLEEGLQEMLASYGLSVEESLVMDTQNEPFPFQVPRGEGGQVFEVRLIDYPFFVDVQPDGMDSESSILASLPNITLYWTSPISINTVENADRDITVLLESSSESWLTTQTNVHPNPNLPNMGFSVPPVEDQKSYPLAVSVQGSFESFFKDKPSPLAETEEEPESDPLDPAGPNQPEEETPAAQVGTIQSSPDTSRLLVIGSAEFLNDVIFELSAGLTGERYRNNLQLMQNAVDWSVEDLDLLAIRSRGTTIRLLNSELTEAEQFRWEIINYVVALVAVVGIGVIWWFRRQNEQPMELLTPSSHSVKQETSTA